MFVIVMISETNMQWRFESLRYLVGNVDTGLVLEIEIVVCRWIVMKEVAGMKHLLDHRRDRVDGGTRLHHMLVRFEDCLRIFGTAFRATIEIVDHMRIGDDRKTESTGFS